MVDFIYDKEAYKEEVDQAYIEALLNEFEKELGCSNCSYSLSFASEDNIRSLNSVYRNMDEVTDILTFRLDDDDSFPMVEGEERELGDIFICLTRMKENASKFNVSPDEELARLCLHGLMHLLGYDHTTNDFNSEEMLIKQEEILKKVYPKVKKA